MLSFHNDPSIKEKYLNRVREHRIADNIIQGTGWKNGKGCAVGCTLENYNHSRYPIELGLPEWLALIEDRIFENLPKEEAMIWPERFLDAIPIGVDVEPVRHHLSILMMDRLVEQQSILLDKFTEHKNIIERVIIVINMVKECHQNSLIGKKFNWEKAKSAVFSTALTTDLSAWAAESAVRSEAWATEASSSSESWSAWEAEESAASAVRSSSWAAETAFRSEALASWAADAAAWAADAAAAADAAVRSSAWESWSSTISSSWKIEADNLIKLLKECK